MSSVAELLWTNEMEGNSIQLNVLLMKPFLSALFTLFYAKARIGIFSGEEEQAQHPRWTHNGQ